LRSLRGDGRHASGSPDELEPLALRVAPLVLAQALARDGGHALTVCSYIEAERVLAIRFCRRDVHLGVRYETPPCHSAGAPLTANPEARGLAGAVRPEAQQRRAALQLEPQLWRVRPRPRLVAGAELQQRRPPVDDASPGHRMEEHDVRRRGLVETRASERVLQTLDPAQRGVVARLGPVRVQQPVGLIGAMDAALGVVAPLQAPERPVQVQVGGHGGDAAPVPVVLEGPSGVVGAELAEEHGPALVQQVERAPRHAGRDARAHVVGVAVAPLLGVAHAVPVHLERRLPGEAEVHRPGLEEGQVVVEAQAGEDDQGARVRCVHRLGSTLHIPVMCEQAFQPCFEK
jgi:hypothetical protein